MRNEAAGGIVSPLPDKRRAQNTEPSITQHYFLPKYQERGFDLAQNSASVFSRNFLARRGGLDLLDEHGTPHLPAL
jgi:hypothetical protein